MKYINTRSDHREIRYYISCLKKHFRNLDHNNLTWNENQQSQFIELILLRFPIQPFYIYEHEELPIFSVVDGLQRLITIDNFYQNKLTLIKPLINSEWIGMKFKDLYLKYREIFEDYYLKIYYINPKIPKDICDEIIRRIKGV